MSVEVVVTGVGIVSSLGLGAAAFESAMLSGACARRPSPVSARGIPVPAHASTLGDIGQQVQAIVSPKYLRRLPSISRWSLAAAVESVSLEKTSDTGGITRGTIDSDDGDETAVVLGTSFGASSYHFEYYEKLFRNGLKDASPLLFSESVMNAAAGHVSIYLKLRGASLALVGGEEVGLTAVIDAFDRLRLGECRVALAGGAEEYCDFVHASLGARGRISAEQGGAYCEGSQGTLLGEGAAILRLEAGRQSSRVLARLAGAGMARSLTGESGLSGSVARAIRESLESARVDPGSVEVVVTSASGSRLDFLEAQGIAEGLGLTATGRPQVQVCAPLARLGEGFAFTSAAQAVVAVQIIASGKIPPSGTAPASAELPRSLRLVIDPEDFRGTRALVVSKSSRGNAVALLLEKA